MIRVLDRIKTQSGFVLLICDKFSDEIVTDRLMSNVEKYKEFSVDPLRGCFSEPISRTIVLKQKDLKDIESIKFVNFI